MNRDRAKQLLPVITAFAEGKVIQTRIVPDSDWHDLDNVLWHDEREYRIKPERRKVWVVFYQNDWIPLAFNTRGYADAEVERVGKLGIRCKVVCVEEP